MASKEAYIATKLDRAISAVVIEDYFALNESEASSDDRVSGKPLFWF